MNNVACVVLAAGKGKRMKSALPKVLHLLNGKPLVEYVLQSCREAGVGRIIVVVGFRGKLVAETVKPYGAEIVWQKQRLGTGHAVAQTQPLLKDFSGEIVVLNGDVPLVSSRTIVRLVGEHRRCQAAATILTAKVDDPTGYGRIVRNESGLVDRVVEQADANLGTGRIREINSGIFCFDPAYLFPVLEEVGNQNRQGEHYLPDVLAILRRDSHPIAAQEVENADEILGVNSPEQLKQIAQLMVKR